MTDTYETANAEVEIKQQVREFYNQVGWQTIGNGVYQNARYEDLRPVSQEYIHRCHLRVNSHLPPSGNLFLDAGSGPIQYPEYVTYSQGYRRRVCVDISIVALEEARERIGDHGLFVVADIANLPFKSDVFDGLISLHTIHHLPLDEHAQAFSEIYRMLAPGGTGIVVNGWQVSTFTRLTDPVLNGLNRLRYLRLRLLGKAARAPQAKTEKRAEKQGKSGTFVKKHNADWLKREIGSRFPLKVQVWRSVNVRFLRTFIHERWGGRRLLRLLYRFEERYPSFFGENGAYPLLVFHKPHSGGGVA